jgi:hypothetical protein
MTLGPPKNAPASKRPHQWGEAAGSKGGRPVTVSVEWLFDTGADVAVVQKRVGDCFDTTPTGASASPTVGSGGILMVQGIMVSFETEDAMGQSSTVSSSNDLGVKNDNAGSNLIGVDQLADVGAKIWWDPSAQSGGLTS